MKQLFMALMLCLFIFPSYANAEKCDYIFTDDEIEKELDNLLEGGTYKDKTASGVFCVAYEDLIKLQFNLKDGKINGGMGINVYYEKDKPAIEVYTNDYNLFKYVDELYDDNDMLNFEVLKNKKIDVTSKVYYENGNVAMTCNMKNGNGDCISYLESGAMEMYLPISNYAINGITEVYDEDGKLWSTITYKDDKIISAECANTISARLRPGGLKWTKAEISNWENGLEVKCGY
ncbi:MAG: hypothetical protein K2N11_07405 [Mucispirillum sp.]|nr:hypothetical protein [Mucispirillum sp.]